MVPALVVCALMLSAGSARAQTPQAPQVDCMAQLVNCYYWAAGRSTWFGAWVAGIDCELSFVACVRKAIFGY
jgi:hypothetical protein